MYYKPNSVHRNWHHNSTLAGEEQRRGFAITTAVSRQLSLVIFYMNWQWHAVYHLSPGSYFTLPLT